MMVEKVMNRDDNNYGEDDFKFSMTYPSYRKHFIFAGTLNEFVKISSK
jgi:hypothetical protein